MSFLISLYNPSLLLLAWSHFICSGTNSSWQCVLGLLGGCNWSASRAGFALSIEVYQLTWRAFCSLNECRMHPTAAFEVYLLTPMVHLSKDRCSFSSGKRFLPLLFDEFPFVTSQITIGFSLHFQGRRETVFWLVCLINVVWCLQLHMMQTGRFRLHSVKTQYGTHLLYL